MTDPQIVSGLLHINDISNLCTKLFFETNSFSSSMSFIIQIHKELYDVKSCGVTVATDNNALLFLKQIVRSPFIHDVMLKNGDYTKPTKELL